jgi:hypothetical protein
MPVDLGDNIQERQELKIDPTQTLLSIQQLEQELSVAKSQHQVSQILGKKLEQHLHFLTKELTRSKTLLQQNGMSQQSVDAQQQEIEQLKIEVEQQKVQQNIHEQQTQLIEVRISQQKDWLKRHTMTLPIGWTVLERHKEIGEIIQIGESILSLVDCRSQLVDLYLDPSEWTKLKGMELTFKYRHYSVQPKASLFHLSPVATKSRKQKVTFWIQNSPAESSGTEISLTLKQIDHEHVIIPKKYSNEAYGQVLVQLENGNTIPIFPVRKTPQGWVVPTSSLNPDIKIVNSTKKED